MIDAEAKRILDKAHQDRDYQELVEQKDIDGRPGPIDQDAIDEFLSVTAAMETTLTDKNPEATFRQKLDTPESFALRALYIARTGRDSETGTRISGLERSTLLNQALIYLQPILALGLRPDFKEGRAIYDQLVEQVQNVRSDIKTAVKVENFIPKPERSQAKAEEEDTDEESPPDDESDGEPESASDDEPDGESDGESRDS